MQRIRIVFVPIVVCVSGCVTSSEVPPATEALARETPSQAREAVDRILEADITVEERMRALEPYVNVGRSRKEIDQVLGGPNEVFGHGPGFIDADYREFGKPSLQIGFYPDGEVCYVTYRTKDGKMVSLQSDDPITWPKTTDGKNALLRQKKGG